MPVIKVASKDGSHAAAAVMGAMSVLLAKDVSSGLRDASKRKTKSEDTRRGNPYGLTVNQHVYPKMSMDRFSNDAGKVEVRDLVRNLLRQANTKEKLFCARRAWDQRAESGYMKSIENQFQALVDMITTESIDAVPAAQKEVVDRFYALWYMRARYRELPDQELQLNGLAGDDLTKEQEEVLERKHTFFIRSGGKAPARQLNGLVLQRRIDDYTRDLSAIVRWGIVRPIAGEFIVPDVPTRTIIPLTPQIALAASVDDGLLTEANLAEINKVTIDGCEEYYFARTFDACPIAA
jgi:hypothetical protein